MNDGDLTIYLSGESMVLLPERAMHWPAHETLFIADPHWGKAATFRSHGIPVPAGTTDEGIARLDRLVQRTSTRTIVFLGDLLHAKAGRSRDMFAALGEWRQSNADVDLLLVRGSCSIIIRVPVPPGMCYRVTFIRESGFTVLVVRWRGCRVFTSAPP